MIAIIDYEMGNLKSVEKAFHRMGFEAEITDKAWKIRDADALVLPGVGAFPDAMHQLEAKGLVTLIEKEVTSGKMVMGICLGMQVFFDKGYEGDECNGLGFIPGTIKRIPEGVKIPHMGWNQLDIHQHNPVLNHIEENTYVYFVHSYYAADVPKKYILAETDYNIEIPAIVQKENIVGVQFHPEKSSKKGLQIIKNFGELSKC
ncbi:glutamine amidotransferase [Tindallia magadiensis]|uniref:Imidazole glycerol phosphate synthase subunit HisH n=1 Tax=Tindallia magadiensis TaxID=69895 RepID=A0A1I3DWG0_9FIRM|nr:imidazole glycerol phosphate synthase subunit HisH [Tindallia magadiensis]SFH91025.1 glutamine amidotransferase [Tindallia magadiensis]